MNLQELMGANLEELSIYFRKSTIMSPKPVWDCTRGILSQNGLLLVNPTDL